MNVGYSGLQQASPFGKSFGLVVVHCTMLLRTEPLGSYLLDRVVHEAEVLRLPDHRPRYEVGLDKLEESPMEIFHPVAAVVREHVQQ